MTEDIMEYFEPDDLYEDEDDGIERYKVKDGYAVEWSPFDTFYVERLSIDENGIVRWETHRGSSLEEFHVDDEIKNITIYKKISN